MQDPMARSECSTNVLDTDLQTAVAELLDLESTDIEANLDSTFIELGGNSIKALELTFKLDAAGKHLDIETILAEGSSISQLSQALSQDNLDNSDPNVSSPEDSNSDVPTPNTEESDDVHKSSSSALSGLNKEVCKQLGCQQGHIDCILPLTSQQIGLWLGSLQAPGAYLSHWQYTLADDIDLGRLWQAWYRVVETNPVLRTRIVSLSDSQLHQVVLTTDYYNTHHEMLEHINLTATEAEPLFSIHIDTNSCPRTLNVQCHHVLYDRWSMRLILQDVQSAYDQQKLPALRPSYVPFLDPVNKKETDAQIEMWRSNMQEEATVSVPIVKSFEGFPLASDVIEVSASVNNATNATIAQLITAAWSLVSSKHCGSNRVSFGLTVWGRDITLSGVTNMTFPTFNTMPFVSTITDDTTVDSFLSATKSQLSLLRRTQRLDIETISSINPACRDACRFNSIVVIQQDMASDMESGLFAPKNLLSFDTTQSSPLVLECTPNKNKVILKMKYDPAYVSSIDAGTMLHHMKIAVDSISSGSHQRLDEVDLFSNHDLQLIQDWVIPSLPLKTTTLHAMLQESANVWPDSIAIYATGLSLTYSALLDHAQNVMSKVKSSNPQSSSNIGVCFEKSPYAVVSMLGISMSGYTFVPMDASNPMNRLMQLVENAQMELVVCSRAMAPKLEEENVKVLVIDAETLDDKTKGSKDCSSVSMDPEANVYIIYTSGSTGEPKGVTMTQQALCTTLDAIADHLEFSPDTRDLQFSSFAFDMSVHDIWCTLLRGGTVCIPTEAERFELEDFIERAQCNYAMFTPSVALTLSDESWRKFKKFSTSGEPLPKAVFQSALRAGVKFWNTYGPTESCIICITEQIKIMDTRPSRLGYSMAATSWIIDADNPNRLAPVGCVGELALTGHTLAKGYYRDPEKTEKAFVPGLEWTKNFPDFPLDKVYRTGDLAKYNNDGSIEFHGRLGGYIKIAGNRVDLGEIEFVLYNKCNLPKVSVQYCKIGTTEVRDLLVSFCAVPSKTTNDEPEILPLTEEIRQKAAKGLRSLREHLPRYMVPVVFFPISRFPYNTAGKLDKKRLINLIANRDVDEVLAIYGIDTQTSEDMEESVEDQELSPQAATLQEAWATVLRTKSVTISGRSNFFQLGGDSLRAMNLSATLRQHEYSIPVSDIFRYPSLNDMALCLKKMESLDDRKVSDDLWSSDETARLKAAAAEVMGTVEEEIETIMPCTSLQTQMLAASAQSSTYIHRECFELGPEVTNAEIEKICRSLGSRNELLRSKAFIDQQTATFVLVVLKSSLKVPFMRKEGTLEQYTSSNSDPMGIGRELTRFILLEHQEARILVWETHHSIFDGYSNILLIQQFHDVASQIREEKSHVQEELAVPSFKDFVNRTQRIDQEEGKKFWTQYLRGASQLDLAFKRPVSRSRATNTKTSRRLDYTVPKSDFTTAIHIRAAFALILSRYSASDDVVFSATNHGRDTPVNKIDELVGPTFSTLPVRCVIDRNENLNDFMSRIQLEAAEIATNQHISSESISSIDDNCRQACQFEVHLLIQSAASEPPFHKLKELGYSSLPDPSPMSLQIPFNLVATAKASVIEFDLIYNNEMFPDEQISLFFDQLLCTLRQVLTAEKNQPVHSIVELGKDNQDAYLSIQPKTSDFGQFAGMTIPELVFNEIGARKNNQALFSTDCCFTYQEMRDLAEGLSKDINEQIGRSRQYIAISYVKSPGAVIAQLAILMAGHAYVSIDSSWTQARMQTVLEQTSAALLITTAEGSVQLRDLPVQLMTFDATCAKREPSSSDPFVSLAQPDSPAYVIFTSGSTGTPKGVVIQNDAICRTLSAYKQRLAITHETRALLFASFSFDASVMETWSILAAGGTLCIPNDEERISDMDAFLKRSQADCIGLTPSGAMLLDPAEHSNLKTLLFCGEKTKAKDIDRWTDIPGLQLVNAYGPSETSVNAVMNTAFSGDDLSNIGQTMGGGLWIVDPSDHNILVPAGGIGELLVSGAVLAKEYLNDPDKTAEKFVFPKWPQWTQVNEQRAYKTGDLVRLDIHGNLQFIGRQDGQLKINGIRIESGEIESTAQKASIAGVEEVIVGAQSRSDNEDGQELVLFFVPASPQQRTGSPTASILPLRKAHQQTITELHEHLKATLPRTHMPGMYIPISAVPVGSTGKTDRKMLLQALDELHPAQIALYRPSGTNQGSQSVTTPTATNTSSSPTASAHTTTESTLASLWSQVLHRGGNSNTSITSSTHFIRAGGDSIAAIRLSSLARSRHIHLPVQLIYSNPVLADMAAAVDGNNAAPTSTTSDTTNNATTAATTATTNMMNELENLVSPAPFELLNDDILSPLVTNTTTSTTTTGNLVKGDGGRGDYFGALG